MGKMKMTKEDYEILKSEIKPYFSVELMDEYKNKGLSEERFRWDLVWRSKTDIGKFYHYLNDNHIDTALRRIVKEFLFDLMVKPL